MEKARTNGDIDSTETKEWLDSLEGVLQTEGVERARFLLTELKDKAVVTTMFDGEQEADQ